MTELAALPAPLLRLRQIRDGFTGKLIEATRRRSAWQLIRPGAHVAADTWDLAVHAHAGSSDPSVVVTIDGAPVTPVARTVVDAACLKSLPYPVATMDDALHRGAATGVEIAETLATQTRRVGIAPARSTHIRRRCGRTPFVRPHRAACRRNLAAPEVQHRFLRTRHPGERRKPTPWRTGGRLR